MDFKYKSNPFKIKKQNSFPMNLSYISNTYLEYLFRILFRIC